ncbi:hypothetical protein [Streptomyces sp. NPDC047315]|uniref:hypothetical protein n=1 Tax=Streptomyces sp. NPDC047315 TaxID=3155142 RepID=UPI0033C741CA
MADDPNPTPGPTGTDPQGNPTPGPTGTDPQGNPAPTPPTNGPQGDPNPAPSTGTERQADDQADAVKAAETARVAAEKRASEAEAEVARLRRSNAAQRGTDIEGMRTEIRAEFTEALVRAEIRAAAAGKLRDPADALALLDVSTLAGSGGDIDAAAVAAAVAELVTTKPYLAADAEGTSSTPTGPAPWGDVGAGPRGGTGPKDEPATPLDRLRSAYGED